jgi:TrpR-related protein YerC/YecD
LDLIGRYALDEDRGYPVNMLDLSAWRVDRAKCFASRSVVDRRVDRSRMRLQQDAKDEEMKRRHIEPETSSESAESALCRALLSMSGISEMRSFLRDLCTPAELEALVDRWRVVPYLLDGVAYREIHDRTGVSVTTIGRVARSLSQGNGGYRAAIAHHAVPAARVRSGKTAARATAAARRPGVPA